MAFEVEAKYPIEDLEAFASRLVGLGAQPVGEPEQHADTYYAHPCRDFVETKEALRLRRIDGRPLVTYKGPKLPGAIKARRELEWDLSPGDHDGEKMAELLVALGFRPVAEVRKRRQNYTLQGDAGSLAVTVDQVDHVGNYAEVESIATAESEVAQARQRITEVAKTLGLQGLEERSYLALLLARFDKGLCEKD